MADRSTIEWVRGPDGSPGATWNPIRGTKGRWSCTKVSPGCTHCYAERINVRMGGPPYVVGADTLRLDAETLTQPLRWSRPRRIFVCSMTDLFEARVLEDWIDRIWQVMVAAHWHTFLVLTKRAERMARLLSGVYAPNEHIWLGVSAENQVRLDERVPLLLKTPAAVRFLSVEPLLGRVDLSEWICPGANGQPVEQYGPPIGWVIVGGESGGPPERALVEPVDSGAYGEWHTKTAWTPRFQAIQWVRQIRDQCVAAGVPFFLKQWGGPTPKAGGRLLDGLEWSEFPGP